MTNPARFHLTWKECPSYWKIWFSVNAFYPWLKFSLLQGNLGVNLADCQISDMCCLGHMLSRNLSQMTPLQIPIDFVNFIASPNWSARVKQEMPGQLLGTPTSTCLLMTCWSFPCIVRGYQAAAWEQRELMQPMQRDKNKLTLLESLHWESVNKGIPEC